MLIAQAMIITGMFSGPVTLPYIAPSEMNAAARSGEKPIFVSSGKARPPTISTAGTPSPVNMPGT